MTDWDRRVFRCNPTNTIQLILRVSLQSQKHCQRAVAPKHSQFRVNRGTAWKGNE